MTNRIRNMKKYKYIILLIFYLLSTLGVQAQDIRISGTVSDDFDPIIGANVIERQE